MFFAKVTTFEQPRNHFLEATDSLAAGAGSLTPAGVFARNYAVVTSPPRAEVP